MLLLRLVFQYWLLSFSRFIFVFRHHLVPPLYTHQRCTYIQKVNIVECTRMFLCNYLPLRIFPSFTRRYRHVLEWKILQFSRIPLSSPSRVFYLHILRRFPIRGNAGSPGKRPNGRSGDLPRGSGQVERSA